MKDKNDVIKEEAIKSMISLIILSNIEKTSCTILERYLKKKSLQIFLINMCFGFYL